MNNITEYYGAMTLEEQARFISHAGASLVEVLYHSYDTAGLKAVTKNFELILGHAQECLSCLEFMREGGDILSKVKLMLEFVAHNGITEDFVTELENMASRAHDDLLSATEDKDLMIIESDMKKRWQATMSRHEALEKSA